MAKTLIFYVKDGFCKKIKAVKEHKFDEKWASLFEKAKRKHKNINPNSLQESFRQKFIEWFDNNGKQCGYFFDEFY